MDILHIVQCCLFSDVIKLELVFIYFVKARLKPFKYKSHSTFVGAIIRSRNNMEEACSQLVTFKQSLIFATLDIGAVLTGVEPAV